MQVCGAIHRFTGWLARVYTRGGPAPGEFKILLLPKADDDTQHASVVELQKVREQLEQKEHSEAVARAAQEQTETELGSTPRTTRTVAGD